jgi:diguanylate cyclase (GGDEF)-like protein/PAS domain S-box-containing protein
MLRDENQIESQKEEVATLKNLLRASEKLLHMSTGSIDYQSITDGMKELSGAWAVGLNTYEESGTKSITRALSGIPLVIKQASKILGFSLTGKEWDIVPERLRNLQGGKLVHYNSIHETSMGVLSKNTAQILERIFNIGDVYVIELSYEGQELLGDIIFFIKKGEKIKDRKAIEVYAGLLGNTLMRAQAEKALQESEAKFRAYMEKTPVGIFVTDMEGHYIEVNQAACQMSGYTEAELLNLSIPDFIAPEFLEKGMKLFEKLQSEGYVEDDIKARKKNGKTYWINLASVIIDSSRVIGFCQDITERKQAEDKLKFQNIILKAQQEVSLDGIFIVNENNKIISFNQRFADMWEIPDDIMASQSGEKALNFVLPKLVDPEEFIHRINYLYENKQEKSHEEIAFKDGRTLERYSAPMFGRDGHYYGRVWYYRDITERKQAEEQIRYLSFNDQLTGIYNRRFLENEMKRLDTERQLSIGIIMADLNGLKLVNDTFGHEVGDKLLKQTAEILRNSCRSEDIIARWGGDEFVIFLPQTTEENVKAIGQRIDEKCKETYVKDIPLSLALGFAIKKSRKKDLAEILKEAEEKMYKHKLAESQRVKSTVLKIMLKNLEAKSFETETHYSVMQNAGHRIGEKIGLSQSSLNKLKVLISLHDIGEITISEEILTKKGPLTAKEWEIIKKHPETGYRIARATEEFAQVAEDILSHHERWDGSGYPQGLKGKEIPLLARITAIVDAYEVMTSGRPYKKAMLREGIIAELKRWAGSQFDPELVDVFLTILKEEH